MSNIEILELCISDRKLEIEKFNKECAELCISINVMMTEKKMYEWLSLQEGVYIDEFKNRLKSCREKIDEKNEQLKRIEIEIKILRCEVSYLENGLEMEKKKTLSL